MFRFALLGSLAANLALGAVLLWQHHSPSPPVSPSAPSSLAPNLPPAEPVVAALAPEHLGPALTDADATLSDADYVARLRAAGVPDAVMIVLLRDRLQRRHGARWQALVDAADTFPYWQRAHSDVPLEIQQAMHELNREESLQLSQLLGREIWDTHFAEAMQGDFDFLPPEKRTQLAFIAQDYATLRQSIEAANLGALLPGDHAVLNLLVQEQDAELAALLTPEEYADYKRRLSPAAAEVQHVLRRFDATEAEYLQLMALHVGIEDQFGLAGTSLPRAERDARREAWKAAQEAFAATLSPERAELWAISEDDSFDRVNSFVAHQRLDPTTTQSLIRLSQDITRRADIIRQDPARTPAQRTAELAALAAEARQNLATTLPPAAFEAYLPRHGRWINALTAASPPPTP